MTTNMTKKGIKVEIAQSKDAIKFQEKLILKLREEKKGVIVVLTGLGKEGKMTKGKEFTEINSKIAVVERELSEVDSDIKANQDMLKLKIKRYSQLKSGKLGKKRALNPDKIDEMSYQDLGTLLRSTTKECFIGMKKKEIVKKIKEHYKTNKKK